MMKNKIPPITPATTLKNAQQWLNIIRYGESGTVIQLQDDCEYRMREILDNPSLLKTVLGPYYKKYLLYYIPAGTVDVHQSIHAALLSLAVKKRLGTKGTLEELSNEELLKEIGQRGYDVGIFLSHITSLLSGKSWESFAKLESLIRMSKNLSVIVFTERDITQHSYTGLADKCSFLFDHVITYPLYSEADTRQFILHYATQWKFKIPEKITSEIVRLGGGYLWIVHQLMRHLRDNPGDTLTQASGTRVLMTKLVSIWEKLTLREQEILRRLTFGTLTDRDLLSHEFRYLTVIRLVLQGKNGLQLGFPLLATVIENELLLSKWRVENDVISIGEKDVSRLFTKKEKIVLARLIDAKHAIVPRDVIAQLLWPADTEGEYSDWALDRLVYRIRKKLAKISPQKELVRTIKKKGFTFG